MCRHVPTSESQHSDSVAARGSLLSELLPPVDRSGDSASSGVVAGWICVSGKFVGVCSRR